MARVRLTGQSWGDQRGVEVEAFESYADHLLEISSDDMELDGAVVLLPDYVPQFPGDFTHDSWGGELVSG